MKKNIKKIIATILLLAMLLQTPFEMYAQVSTHVAQSESTTSPTVPTITPTTSEELTPSLSIEELGKTEIAQSAQLELRAKVRALLKKSLRADEKVTLIVDNAKTEELKVTVFNPDGEKVTVDIQEIAGENPVVLKIIPRFKFKPGRYRVKVSDRQGVISTQDFTWGVLALNTNKSIYTPHETAKISIAVLDQTGEMVCDADVTLTIEDPEGKTTAHTTEAGSIRVNEACRVKALTLEPDYEARYTVEKTGAYTATLTATTAQGTYTIEDSFEVRETVPFDIERTTATRIYPPVTYPVSLTMTANEDFEGEITEYVPEEFEVTELDGHEKFESINVITATDELDEIQDAALFSLSLPFKGEHRLTQEFGEEVKDFTMGKKYSDFGVVGHDGIDFDMPIGTEVVASAHGQVVMARERGDYGTTIVLQHSWGKSYYGHLSKMLVKVGDIVKKGEVIALSGNTGISSGPHLHFGIKPTRNDTSNGYYGKINPMRYFSFEALASTQAETKKDTAVLGVTTEDVPHVIKSDNKNLVQVVTWKVKVKKGETIKLGYSFKAPRVWPELYLLGPLQLRNTDSALIFQEVRRWKIAADADGSGTNTVSPNTGTTSATDQTYTFTFTAAETMDSGGFTITVPSGWTAPQGTGGAAGYTTVSSSGNATVATVISNADSLTGWAEDDTDMCNSGGQLALDATVKQEGTGSISCDNSLSNAADANDSFGFDFTAQNWSSYSQLGVWVRADNNQNSGDIDIGYDDTAACSSPLEQFAVSALTIDTWTYQKFSLTAARTSVTTVCVLAGGNTSIDSDIIWVDDVLVGPGVPTFSGSGPWTINTRILDAANTETFTVTYGSTAGGAGGDITNPASVGVHTFTTRSRTSSAGTLTDISSSPTVTLSSAGGGGPTLNQIMRHGNWFNGGVEQPFTF